MSVQSVQELELGLLMTRYAANIAAKGDSNGGGSRTGSSALPPLPPWPAWTEEAQQVPLLDTASEGGCRTLPRLRTRQCETPIL